MKNLEQTFTIHPIGQGFFYSGTIKIDNRVRFRMVFDCGSNSKDVDDEINGSFIDKDVTIDITYSQDEYVVDVSLDPKI